MPTPRRLLATGALIAVPVAFAVGSVVLAQMPPSPKIPSEPVTVQLAPRAPSEEPAPAPAPVVPAPAPAPPPAQAPAPAPAPAPPAPPAGDDDDDNGGDDD